MLGKEQLRLFWPGPRCLSLSCSLSALNSIRTKQGLQISKSSYHNSSIMGNLLYVIAVLLVIGWLIGFVGYSAGGLIHVLLVIAVIVVLLRLIQGKKPLWKMMGKTITVEKHKWQIPTPLLPMGLHVQGKRWLSARRFLDSRFGLQLLSRFGYLLELYFIRAVFSLFAPLKPVSLAIQYRNSFSNFF